MTLASDRRVRPALLEPLRRALAWVLGHEDAEGRLVCPEHGVEHTGKSACVAILAAELGRLVGEGAERDALEVAAVRQGRRLVANLRREGTSPCHTFRPGRHDPYNCSNAVIDGGACSDALAHLVTGLGERLDAADRERFAAASLLHARTYLRYAVLDKGVPAQRAWGTTGLAGALALERDPVLERALAEAAGMLEGVQGEDGSYPYHPLAWGAEHVGASDVSSFYQSRVTAFLLYAQERAGRDPREGPHRGQLERGLAFLRVLQGPDGLKPGLVEAKPWYWGAEYEVASHPFDVYALARGWRLWGRPEDGRAAARAFDAWARHLAPDGEPRSHLPGHGRGRSYQCPLFWAAHACWLARAAEDLEAVHAAGLGDAESEPAGGALDVRVRWCADAELARVEDGRVVAWVRGARPGCNVHHGSPHGAGVVRAVRRADGTSLLARCRLGSASEGEWVGHAGLPSLARGLRSGGRELRFSLWLARVHARAGRRRDALLAPARVAKRGVLAFGHSRVGSAFALTPEVRVDAAGVELASRLARRDGEPLERSDLRRRFAVDGEGLLVEEELRDAGGARGVRYVLPAAAREVAREEGRIRYRLA